MSKETRYLLDVNLLIALTLRDHAHHEIVREWFNGHGYRQWAACALTEAGLVRYVTSPRPGQITINAASDVLKKLTQHPGYRYVPIDAGWETLCSPFIKRLFGHNQVTDAYLLGLAVRHGLVLVTMDKGIVHLAGSEYAQHVLLLKDESVTNESSE